MVLGDNNEGRQELSAADEEQPSLLLEKEARLLDDVELERAVNQVQSQMGRGPQGSTTAVFSLPRPPESFPSSQGRLSEHMSNRSRQLSRSMRPELVTNALPPPTAASSIEEPAGSSDPASGIDVCWPWRTDKSLMLFSPQNSFRLFCRRLVANLWFSHAIQLVIIASVVCLALERPYGHLEGNDGGLQRWISYSEYFYLTVFTIEFALNVIIAGFVILPVTRECLNDFGPPFARVGMNWVDLVVLTASWLPIFLSGRGTFEGLRALRALRTLRALTSITKVRELLVGMLVCLPILGNVVLQTFLIFLIFGIVGMNAFAGLMHQRCNDGTIQGQLCGRLTCSEMNPVGSLLDVCSVTNSLGTVFPNPNYGYTGFDNIFMALQTVFAASTLEGWSVVMYQAMDVSTTWAMLYFIVLVFLGSFVLANLVVAVIVDTFQRVHATFIEEKSDLIDQHPRVTMLKTKCRDAYCWLGSHFVFLSSTRQLVRSVVENRWFDWLVLLVVIANTISMAMEHDGMSDDFRDDLNICNTTFTLVFVGEMIVKLFALGARDYFCDTWNLLDFFVGLESAVELSIPATFPAFSIFRALRILRIVRLLKSTKGLRILAAKIAKSASSILTFIPLFGLFIFMFSITGMHLLGGYFHQEDGSPCISGSVPDTTCPRSRWATLSDSLLTVFQIVTGENWIDAAYDAMNLSNSWVFGFFFVMLVTLNYFLLNIFLATIVVDFSDISNLHIKGEGIAKTNPDENSVIVDFDPPEIPQSPRERQALGAVSNTGDQWAPGGRTSGEGSEPDGPEVLPARDCLPGFSRCRRLCVRIAESATFELIVICTTVIASVSLACWSPNASQRRMMILEIIDLVGLIIFVVEALIKIIAFGFCFSKNSYLRDGWNIIDFLVVLTGVVDVALSQTDIDIFRSFRALRAIRPLRLIGQFKGLKLVTKSLTLAVVPSLSVLFLAVTVWFTFAILGVQLWAGAFYFCNCTGAPDCNANLIVGCDAAAKCDAMGGTWSNLPSNFDHAGNAMLTLFEVATLENWLPIMYAAIDANGKNCQPSFRSNPAAAIYFVLFISVGSFYVLNLFVSVLIDTVAYIKKTHEGTAFMSPEQLEWIEGKRIINRMGIRRINLPPQASGLLAGVRQGSFRLAVSKHFDLCIASLVGLSTALMAAEFWRMSPKWEVFHLVASGVFALLFMLEIGVKILGLGIVQYSRDRWNIFDFIATITTTTGFLLQLLILLSPSIGVSWNVGVLRIFRVLRLLRILRLVKTLRVLRVLFETLFLSLPAILNIGAVLFLLFFIYAVAGVELFGRIRYDKAANALDIMEDPSSYGGGLHRYSNFSNFGWALLTLLRCVTGESWNSVMWDIRSAGGFDWAPLYFVSFVILGSFVILNLFIALVMEAFTTTLSRDGFKVKEEHYDRYTQAWSRYDPDGDWEIHPRDLKRLVTELDPPLGIGANASVREVLLFVESLNLQVNSNGCLEFRAVLFALARLTYSEADVDYAEKRKESGVNLGRLSALSELIGDTARTSFRPTGRRSDRPGGTSPTKVLIEAKPETIKQPSDQEMRYHLACGTLQDAARTVISQAKGMTDELGHSLWPDN